MPRVRWAKGRTAGYVVPLRKALFSQRLLPLILFSEGIEQVRADCVTVTAAVMAVVTAAFMELALRS